MIVGVSSKGGGGQQTADCWLTTLTADSSAVVTHSL